MQKGIIVFFIGMVVGGVCAYAEENQRAQEAEMIMTLINSWLVAGSYDNSAQVAAEEAENVSQSNRHMYWHQSIMPVKLDGFDGLTFFIQLSRDGTSETVGQVGIDQYVPDPDAGTVRMRLNLFKDQDPYVDAHLDLSKLDGLTADDVFSIEGCDFQFARSEDGTRLIGSMFGEPGCYPTIRRTGKKEHHIDDLVIMPGEVWNNPRSWDMEGKLLYGNTKDLFAEFVRIEE